MRLCIQMPFQFTHFNIMSIVTKRYTRLESIELPKPDLGKDQIRKLIAERASYRQFSKIPITRKELSEVLYFSAGLTHKSITDPEKISRSYPSAGAKYPLELYVLVQYGKDLQPGLYHYNIIEHSLDILLSPVPSYLVQKIWKTQEWFKSAGAIIFITALFERTTAKYGKAGTTFPFIEAGHVVQNTYLITQTLKLGCCAIGQFNEKELVKLLDINPVHEIPIYYVAVGN